ncbi:MAG TPA: electron transfer flavoprotein subunit alpha/FixB family protein [Candidatus Dormibacteraeota bacterium]|jgi:electron transfer flavoprotein alpha subunit|nr:electron transfer flavoprotein subunit alpha/FixB family protein [Candidatus Dormibacteraeota bacterium]
MAEIWVHVEGYEGDVAPITLEILSKARTLGADVVAVAMGSVTAHNARLGEYGATKVLSDARSEHDEYFVLPAVEVFAALARERKPAAILFGGSYDGRDIATRVAARLGVGMAAFATEVSLEGEDVKVDVPIFGATLISHKVFAGDRPRIVTVRPKAFAAEASGGGAPAVEEVSPELGDATRRVKVLETKVEASEGPKLEEAAVVVTGGRGMGGPENFPILQDLAGLLGGAVGATRAVVDAGWVPYAMQVGQTGKTVKPNVYIAAGVSGAMQHTVGMKGSKNIISINKDEEAPIFKLSDLGIVGDVHKVLPQIIDAVKAKKGG